MDPAIILLSILAIMAAIVLGWRVWLRVLKPGVEILYKLISKLTTPKYYNTWVYCVSSRMKPMHIKADLNSRIRYAWEVLTLKSYVVTNAAELDPQTVYRDSIREYTLLVAKACKKFNCPLHPKYKEHPEDPGPTEVQEPDQEPDDDQGDADA